MHKLTIGEIVLRSLGSWSILFIYLMAMYVNSYVSNHGLQPSMIIDKDNLGKLYFCTIPFQFSMLSWNTHCGGDVIICVQNKEAFFAFHSKGKLLFTLWKIGNLAIIFPSWWLSVVLYYHGDINSINYHMEFNLK